MTAVDLADPSGAWLGFAGTVLMFLGGITVALINTRRKVNATEAMTVEIHHMVNSQRTAMERRIGQLHAQLVAAGIIPDVAPLEDIVLAGGTMTVSGEATTLTGEPVVVTGEAVITPDLDPDTPDLDPRRDDDSGG